MAFHDLKKSNPYWRVQVTRNCNGKVSFKQYLINGRLLEAKKRICNMAVDAESKCNLVVVSTAAERTTIWQKKDYQSNMIYANILRKIYQSQ